MLNPDTAIVLSEALRAPHGFEIDSAVVTTYSLDLTAMLVAPMTFAFGDVADAGAMESGDPVQILDAVKRHIDRTTVFCQAAAIHVPATHSRIHTFLEDSIFQVEPPHKDALFHPKLWVLRFKRANDAALHHRVVIASRNLTLDNSWDTALVLDEAPWGTIDAAAAADFLLQLPALCVDRLPEARSLAIADLCATLRAVQFEAPEPFTDGELLPLGLSSNRPWPFAEPADRTLAISPFLSHGTLARLRSTTTEAVLLSRAETMDEVGARATADWDQQILAPGVDLREEFDPGQGQSGPSDATAHDTIKQLRNELTGLHAKTIVTDHHGGRSQIVTGSANLTSAAWERNIEFDAVLSGPTPLCGVEAVLGRKGKEPGLQLIMEPYSPVAEDPTVDPATSTRFFLEGFHRELARAEPRARLDIIPRDDSSVAARLTLTLPDVIPGDTQLWLSTVPGQRRPLADTITWDIATENITPFIAIETTTGSGQARVTRRCMIMVPIIGDPIERRQRALADILNSSQRVLRYLAFLLGIDQVHHPLGFNHTEPSSDIRIDSSLETADRAQGAAPIVLFEPLVRAVGSDSDRLASVAEQIAEIVALPQSERLIPPEFLEMWDVVLSMENDRKKK